MTFHGIIPVYKPRGYTSHDIVAVLRKITGQKRVGHTGTLDPQVEGVLPICLGNATRVAEYIQDLPKRYRGSFVVGAATDTQDQSGKIIEKSSAVKVDKHKIEDAFMHFLGEIQQIPPMYSAVKVNGKRLYKSAREGETVDRTPRKVQIYQLSCLSLDSEGDLPVIHFDVLCSKGTYIRTLCVDIGKKMNLPAHMNSLTRVQGGPFHLEDCFTLEEIQNLGKQEQIQTVLTETDEVLGHFPGIVISDNEEEYIRNGCAITVADDEGIVHNKLFRIYTESGRFCALYYWDQESGLGVPRKVFGM